MPSFLQSYPENGSNYRTDTDAKWGHLTCV